MKFPTQQTLKKYPHTIVDGKKVYFMSKKNLPPISILKEVYSKINDDRRIPVVFETKKQYLVDYIKNQEHVKKYDFPKKQEQAYIKRELKDMGNIVSRYTTKKNKYIEPRMVFFTDKKINKQGYKQDIYHEYGHEEWERSPTLRKTWSSHIAPASSPTMYGKTDKEEDFCESYALQQTGFTVDKNRAQILKDVNSKGFHRVNTYCFNCGFPLDSTTDVRDVFKPHKIQHNNHLFCSSKCVDKYIKNDNSKNNVVTPIQTCNISTPQTCETIQLRPNTMSTIQDYNTQVHTKINSLAQGHVKPDKIQTVFIRGGQYEPKTNTIYVNPINNLVNRKDVINHEVGHMINPQQTVIQPNTMNINNQTQDIFKTKMDVVSDIQYKPQNQPEEHFSRRFNEYAQNPQQYKNEHPDQVKVFEKKLGI